MNCVVGWCLSDDHVSGYDQHILVTQLDTNMRDVAFSRFDEFDSVFADQEEELSVLDPTEAKLRAAAALAAPMSDNHVELSFEADTSVPFVPPNCLQFYMTFEKHLGIGVDISPHDGKTLLIGRIKPGPIAIWNANREATAVDRVRRGDRIVEVNGATGDAALLLERMRLDKMLHITIRRLLEIRATLHVTPQNSHGLRYRDDASGSGLLIEAVTHGAAMDVNRRVGAEMEIRPGDLVVSVNGVAGDCRRLRSQLTDSSARQLQLVLRRPREGSGSDDPPEALLGIVTEFAATG
jgi:hypothetical protein